MTESTDATTPPCGGYVLIHRKLFKNPTFKSEFEAMAFAWLVTKASWRDVTVRYKDRAITLKRGQLAISVRDMAMKLERTRQWADRFMARLTQAGIIETDSETGVNVVTIRNYDLYQRPWDSAGTPSESPPGQRRDTTGTQNNKGNKGNKEKEEKKWVLPDWIDADAWGSWEAYRKEKKKPMTDHARNLCVGKLEEAKALGFSPRETIDLAILNGWQGLYIPKGKPQSAKDEAEKAFWNGVI